MFKKIVTVFVLINVLLLAGNTSIFAKPQPDFTFWGTAYVNGVPLTQSDTDYTITLEVDGTELVGYTMGDVSDYGDFYVLKVPMDDDPAVPDKGFPGDEALVFINGSPVDENPLTLGNFGETVSQDIHAAISVNRPPVLDPIGAKSVAEGELLEFTIIATDPDGDALSYSAGGLPPGASFDPDTQTFTWTPGFGEAGNYAVTFTVTDNGTPPQSDSEEVTITVGDVNRPPVLDPIGAKSVDEGELLEFVITATDPDGNDLTYSASNVPAGASFDPVTQTFTWTPDYGEAGNYAVTFTVTDDGTPPQSDSEEVTITVGDVNRPPVLDPIGAKSVDEGELLEFVITANDPDGNDLTYSAGGLPPGASFDPDTQTFTWTPGFGESGNYAVTFTVTDNGTPPQSDSEEVTITVGDVNRPPVLDPIGAKSVDEGELLEFVITANDPDGNDLTYAASNVPAGASFDPATQAFTWTPDFGEAGNYNVTFTVTDDGTPPLSDSEEVTITVGDVNRPPVLDPIGAKSVDEGELLEFTITANDPDGDDLTYSASGLPPGASFDPASQTFTWTPGFGESGNYAVTFTVTDNGTPPQSDSEEVTITVGDVNRPPVLDPIGAKSVDEGELLEFVITANDPDGNDLTYSAGGLPPGASFDPDTQTFTWTPGFGESGNYAVTFTVTDNGTPPQSDSEEVTITVGDVNRPPVLDPIGAKSVDEGELLEFVITATDPDGDALTYSASNVPAGASFDPDTQTFTWTPDYGEAGNYAVTFTVTDDGTPPQSDSEEVTITVGDVNRPPVLDPIGAKSVDEGELLEFVITATDPDGDALTYSAGNVPAGASFDPATQTFTWTPDYGEAGNYAVTFTVTDDGTPPQSDSEEVTITVGDVNRPPVLDPIGAKSVDEGELLEFVITANDPDGDALTYSASNVPAGASFDPATQTFTWTPDYGEAGNYAVTFTVTDNGTPPQSDSEEVTITVGDVNRPPVLDPIGAKSVDEGELLEFVITATDPDGDALTYSASNVPAGASFDPATQTFTWTPDYGEAGNYAVTFTVTDDGTPPQSDSEEVTITVGDVNRPPVLDPIGAKSVNEGELLEFVITATDPDGDTLTYSASNVPAGASFDPATQAFTWTPDYGEAGNYNITFTVTDNGTPPQSDSEEVTITVGDVNRPPVLDPIGAKSVNEGELLEFVITATDPDGDALTYSASNVPAGASFDPATQTFTWTPDYGEAGNYAVTFTVTDNGTPPQSDSEEVTITVGDVNRPPVLDPIGAKSVNEGELLEFVITATDPDGDTLTYSASNVPAGASFDPATQTFTWTPDYGEAGNYAVTFTVTDNGTPPQSDSEEVTITVGDVNRPPVLDPIGAKSVDEGELLEFVITATDPDGDDLTYSASNVPAGASFDPATQTFTWTPDFGEAGNYAVTFTVTDDGTPPQSDSEEVTITVGDVNRPPVLDSIGAKSVDEGELLEFVITANDPDGDDLTYSVGGLPPGASFDPATQTFNWTPGFGEAGNYAVTFTVTDDGTPPLSGSEEVTITVNEGCVEVSVPSVVGMTEADALAAITDAGLVMEVTYEVTGDPKGYVVSQLPLAGEDVCEGSVVSVVVSLNNPPVADAGPDQADVPLDPVELDGSGSSDIDGDVITYSWTIISKPDVSVADLTNPNDVRPTLNIDVYGSYEIELVVNDGEVNSTPDTVMISTHENLPPVADAGDGWTVSVYDTVWLDGSGSYDPNGDDVSYNWSIISKPEGSDAGLDNPISDQPCFTPDKVGDYVVQLIVNDGELDSEPDTVTISAEGNTAPVAKAGTDQTVAVGEDVFLDGSGSFDPDDDPISFRWSIISKPEESLAELDDAGIVDPCFTPDKAADYVVQLIVNDGELDSEPDTVVITVKESSVIEVEIDIKPGSCPNPLNPKSKGVLPVAVLGTQEFDVTTIDPQTILLGREGIEEGIAPIRYSYEDIATPFEGELCDCHDLNGDGYLDLTLKFRTQELVDQLELSQVAGETIPLTLTGNFNEEDGGMPIEGQDCVWILN